MADNEEAGPIAVEQVVKVAAAGSSRPNDIAWSPDGRQLVAGYGNGCVGLWPGRGPARRLGSPTDRVSAATAVAWAPARLGLVAVGSQDRTVRVWSVTEAKGFSRELSGCVEAVGWSPDGDLAAGLSNGQLDLLSATGDVTLSSRLWRVTTSVRCLDWSPDGKRIVVGSNRGDISVVHAGSLSSTPIRDADGSFIQHVAWSPEGWVAAATGGGIEIRDPESGGCSRMLEVRDREVVGMALRHADGLLIAASWRETTLWRTDTWEPVAQIDHHPRDDVFGVAFSPTEPRWAVRGDGSDIEIWRVDVDALLGQAAIETVHYTTAKIVLVGESGVGKTGLGHRLATGEYTEHSSTHGQRFWPLGQLSYRRDDGTECEAVLWDLAGQPDYRLIHSLFLDDADLALLVFDPTEGRDPLKAVDFWRSSLRAGRDDDCTCILVGGRADRGSLVLGDDEVAAYCRAHGIAGGYVETSARDGKGLDQLLATVRRLIRWDDMVPTVTTRTFKRIKEQVLAAKSEQVDEVVVTLGRLREITGEKASDAELMAAAGHLSHHGFVAVLRRPTGDHVVVLRPELLHNLAASYVLEARRNSKGLGAVDERRLVPGGYAFPELAGLATADQELLLEAATVLFLEHNVCFRETWGADAFLIFPELIKLRKRGTDDIDLREGTAYRVKGSVENVYAALVVLLGYTNIFRRTDQWVDEARYELRDGRVCGLRQIEERDGELELVLLFAPATTAAQRHTFRGLFEDILHSRRVMVERYPPLVCAVCDEQQERATVIRRQRKGRHVLRCEECGEAIDIPSTAGASELTDDEQIVVAEQRRIAAGRTELESAITRVKGLVRGDKPPSCFVSYAWGDRDHERWVEDVLVADLRKADVEVAFDQRDNAVPGSDVARFVERIGAADWVVVIGTADYLAKHQNEVSSAGSVVAAEMDLINQRLIGSEERKRTVLPVLRADEPDEALPLLLQGRVRADMREDEGYFGAVFDLLLTLHGIAFDDEAVVDLRRRVRQELDGR